MSHKLCPLVIGVALSLSSCASSHHSGDSWVYAISRAAYDGDCRWASPGPGWTGIDHPCEAAVLVAIVLLPFAVDTVLLPITVPHDLLYVR